MAQSAAPRSGFVSCQTPLPVCLNGIAGASPMDRGCGEFVLRAQGMPASGRNDLPQRFCRKTRRKRGAPLPVRATFLVAVVNQEAAGAPAGGSGCPPATPRRLASQVGVDQHGTRRKDAASVRRAGPPSPCSMASDLAAGPLVAHTQALAQAAGRGHNQHQHSLKHHTTIMWRGQADLAMAQGEVMLHECGAAPSLRGSQRLVGLGASIQESSAIGSEELIRRTGSVVGHNNKEIQARERPPARLRAARVRRAWESMGRPIRGHGPCRSGR